ncbi:MAG: non-heme iron oxygenase ferredoxin subunit [Alphaproteobacteria bacterium]|nr:MAG: non-heme iron oxygenase ferredoxin subunit [Alphaproteobacteria bacterium]
MDWHRAAASADLAEGAVLGRTVAGQDIALYRYEGQVYATHNICTHAYALLSDGYFEDGEIECPIHAARFDVRTGRALCAPASVPVKTFQVEEKDGDIWVKTS